MSRDSGRKGGLLQSILERRREQVRAAEALVSLGEVRRRAAAAGPPRSLRMRLRRAGGVHVIAEIKRASPAAGILKGDLQAGPLAEVYRDAGAAAISVLTEEDFFRGRARDLIEVRRRVDIPLLRKDFVLSVYQVHESRALGADALLLIAAVLPPPRLRELLSETRDLGMEALVEVHDEPELEAALAAGADLIGVNNRDLGDFRVSLEVSLRLAERIPPGVVRVAESGIRTGGDVRRLRDAGYHGFLVGEVLVRSPDPGRTLRELIGWSM